MVYKPEPDAGDLMFKEVSPKRQKQIDLAIYNICYDICANLSECHDSEIYQMIFDFVDENSDHYFSESDPETSP